MTPLHLCILLGGAGALGGLIGALFRDLEARSAAARAEHITSRVREEREHYIRQSTTTQQQLDAVERIAAERLALLRRREEQLERMVELLSATSLVPGGSADTAVMPGLASPPPTLDETGSLPIYDAMRRS